MHLLLRTRPLAKRWFMDTGCGHDFVGGFPLHTDRNASCVAGWVAAHAARICVCLAFGGNYLLNSGPKVSCAIWEVKVGLRTSGQATPPTSQDRRKEGGVLLVVVRDVLRPCCCVTGVASGRPCNRTKVGLPALSDEFGPPPHLLMSGRPMRLFRRPCLMRCGQM